MHHLSSQLTLVFRLFLPIFLGTIILLSCFVAVFHQEPTIFGLPTGLVRFLLPGFLFLFFLVWYYKLRSLFRVEASADHVYINNYDQVVRYAHADLASIKRRWFGPFEMITISLPEAGLFGQDITFLASRRRLAEFVAGHEVWKGLLNNG
jgi:hypothetical protein